MELNSNHSISIRRISDWIVAKKKNQFWRFYLILPLESDKRPCLEELIRCNLLSIKPHGKIERYGKYLPWYAQIFSNQVSQGRQEIIMNEEAHLFTDLIRVLPFSSINMCCNHCKNRSFFCTLFYSKQSFFSIQFYCSFLTICVLFN